jgi:3-oxoacyl-[acyl-carrier protein] reductase
MGRFEGKVALVTGGGTGIGRATSLMLAAEGAAVAVNYSRSREDAERTVADVRAHGVRAVACQADVADDGAVTRMFDSVVGELGRLDFLINSAGTTRPVPLADVDAITPEDFQRIYAVNVNGVFWCCRAAIRHMRSTGGHRSGGGHIVTVSSLAGFSGQGSSLVYGSSKAAAIALTRGLAASHAPDIQVNAVAPGLVETRWIKDFSPETIQAIAGQIPMGRVAQPQDVADAIFGLLVSSYITGEVVLVSGGRTS